MNRWYMEESNMVVVDRSRKGAEVDDGFYLVIVEGMGDGRSGRLKVERRLGLKVRDAGESLGTVVLLVRPSKMSRLRIGRVDRGRLFTYPNIIPIKKITESNNNCSSQLHLARLYDVAC
ncbi:Rubisco accumulation factor 1.2, chloroplastic [Linum perenne]